MKLPIPFAAAAMIVSPANAVTPTHQVKAKHPPRAEAANKAVSASAAHAFFHPSETRSTGTVTVGGQPRTGLAAFDGSGALLSWSPPTVLGNVLSVAASDSGLVAGGGFTAVGAEPLASLAWFCP